MKNSNKWWFTWIIFTLALLGYYSKSLNGVEGYDRAAFLPGKTSDGHYQIEKKCETCHGEGFDDKETLQKSCVRCHSKELKKNNDSHPKKKFTNPRNADRVALLDARYCTTCHSEHNTDKTNTMGVTLPEDYCFICHKDIAKNRPSHKGMSFDSCDDAGCHNYHDNKALYEEYLVKHSKQNKYLSKMVLPEKNLKAYFQEKNDKFKTILTPEDIDSPEEINFSQKIIYQWQKSSHSKSGVNCKACHEANDGWLYKPGIDSCKTCHKKEAESFLSSKHGMRIAEGLPPMKVSEARSTMHKDAKNKIVNCQSCHSDHDFNTKTASIDACLNCHADKHSKAYKKSKHYRAYLTLESNGESKSINQGVSCATCHMPRVTIYDNYKKRILVDHNQNNTLRPNEKMIRSVCMNCHGLKFSLESLADKTLINNNFDGSPSRENKGIEMAMIREDLKRRGLIKDNKE